MDKFLNFCFKFGKVFTAILLVLFLFLFLISIIFVFTTIKKVELKPPTFSEINANIQAVKNNQTTANNNQAEPYILYINDISKKYLSDYGKQVLTKEVNEIDYKYRIDYLQGFEAALYETKVHGSISKMNQKQYNELFELVVTSYDMYFHRKLQEKELQELKLKTERLVAISIISSSILLFILCLIIPLLIKIEENTRK